MTEERRVEYEFTCKRCGEHGSVPFEPNDPDDVLCRECYEETGGRTYDLSKVTRAPRRKHNTRVAFAIVCSECGKEDELDYVPKGVPMSEILCKKCMADVAGEKSRWALVEEQKSQEQRKKNRWEFICADCGCLDQLPFEPHDDREYFCYDCYLRRQREEELERRGSKHDLGDNVFIRRRKRPAETEE
jgi:CxxC-x17-CxxC domain-containing protein